MDEAVEVGSQKVELVEVSIVSQAACFINTGQLGGLKFTISTMLRSYLRCSFLEVFDKSTKKDKSFRRIGFSSERKVTAMSCTMSRRFAVELSRTDRLVKYFANNRQVRSYTRKSPIIEIPVIGRIRKE